MRTRSFLLAVALIAGGLASPPAAQAKDKPKPPAATPGFSKLDAPPNYVYLSVPADYDAKKFYPLLFVLHPSEPGKPEDFVAGWAGTSLGKSWIIASLYCPIYDTDLTAPSLAAAVAKVKSVYHIDEKRVVLAGHNAGAQMAWHLWIVEPKTFAALIAFSAGIGDPDRGTSGLKKLEGKPCYLFRGSKDTTGYSATQLEQDRKVLEAMKLEVTVEVKPDFDINFPTDSMPKIVKWVEGIWPPGAFREKATDVENALELKDLPRAYAALAALQSEMKRNPYPAFEPSVAALQAKFLEIGRAMIDAAKRLEAGGQPLLALEAMEAAVKALKGLKPLDTEVAAALVALKKDSDVAEALRKKEAEASASSYMERAAVAEAKGDLAKALEWYRKVAALGETSKQTAAAAKITDLEPKVAGK